MGKSDAAENINNAAQRLLDKISETDIVCYTDGSAHEGTKNGGAGATVEIPGSDKITIKSPCGIICSSYRAEMIAIERALQAVKDNLDCEVEFDRRFWVITDSQSSVITLRHGPGNQFSESDNKIWEHINNISEHGIKIVFQWIPGHRGIPRRK